MKTETEDEEEQKDYVTKSGLNLIKRSDKNLATWNPNLLRGKKDSRQLVLDEIK